MKCPAGGGVSLRMVIRDAVEADLPGIFAIYDREVLHGTCTSDTQVKSDEERLAWFATAGGRYPVLVAEIEGRIAGWTRLYQWSARCAYDRAAENAVYVHEEFRGRGVGRALLAALIARCPQIGVRVIIARVVEGNPESLGLHERAGFQTIGIMRQIGEKFGRLLDVRLLSLHLDDAGRVIDPKAGG